MREILIAVMPYAKNRLDGNRIYFEDDEGVGTPVVLHGGLLDSLRVADAVAVLDELGIERAHFIGLSWGGRLGFGIGQHAPDRALSLVIGGQQPYGWPDTPLSRIVTAALAQARTEGIKALVEAFEAFWDLRFPVDVRAGYLENDPVALDAAWSAGRNEGAISEDLGAWQVPCLIFMGAGDADFLDQARRAAQEIPNARFLLLEEADHYGAHTSRDVVLLDAVLDVLREASPA